MVDETRQRMNVRVPVNSTPMSGNGSVRAKASQNLPNGVSPERSILAQDPSLPTLHQLRVRCAPGGSGQ